MYIHREVEMGGGTWSIKTFKSCTQLEKFENWGSKTYHCLKCHLMDLTKSGLLKMGFAYVT